MTHQTLVTGAMTVLTTHMRRMAVHLSFALALLASATVTAAHAQTERPAGETFLTAANYCPAGTSEAAGGSAYSRSLSGSPTDAVHYSNHYGQAWGPGSVSLPDLNGTNPYGPPGKLPAEGLRYCVVTEAQHNSLSAQAPSVGEVKLYATDFCPAGWIEARGQRLPLDDHNQILFAVIGHMGTMDMSNPRFPTFSLPNLSGKEPVSGLKYCIAVSGEYPNRP